MSRGLAHVLFRNGIVEDLHSKNASLDQETMKALNKDVYNRCYTIMRALVVGMSGHKEVLSALCKILSAEGMYGCGTWDPAEIEPEIECFIQDIIHKKEYTDNENKDQFLWE